MLLVCFKYPEKWVTWHLRLRKFYTAGLVSTWFSHLEHMFFQDPEKKRHTKGLWNHWLNNFLLDSMCVPHFLALTSRTSFLGDWRWWEREEELCKQSKSQIETYSVGLLGLEPTLTLAAFRFQLVGVKHKCPVAEWFPHASFMYLN